MATPKKTTAKVETTKKTVTKKAAPKKADPVDTEIRLQEAQTNAKELEAARTAAQKAKGEVTTLKIKNETLKEDVLKANESATKYANELLEAKAKLIDAYKESEGWLNRGNKWAFAAVPIIIALGIYFLALRPQINTLQTKLENCQRFMNDKQNGAAADSAGKAVTDLRTETKKITETPSADVKKNGSK